MSDFLTGIYNVGAGSNFDIVNAHAYADSTFGYGHSRDVDINPRLEAISARLHQVVLAQQDAVSNSGSLKVAPAALMP